MAKLTATKVRALVKNGLPGRHSDGNGLYLMLPKRGEPYWMLRYTLAGKRRELTLAKFVELSLAEARERAVEAQKEIRSGIDPIEERKREGRVTLRTVSDLFEDWYLDLEKRLKHPRIPKRIFLREVSPSIGGIPIGDVTPMDVRAIIKKVAGSDRPTIANDTLMYLKQLFNHAIKLGLIKYNPASAFTVTDAGGVEKSRERALTVEEIQHVFKVFRENSDSFTRENYLACAMLLILGVRKTELTEAKWSEFDLKNECWTLPAERSKSGVEIVIPLPPNTVKWLDELKIHACGSDYVFPNRRSSKHPHMGKDTLNRAISKLFGKEPGRKQQPENKMGDIAEFTVHDLRRTCRSLMASAGVPGHVAERCLNHKLKGVEGIYDRYDYFDERREALAKVEGLVISSVEDQ
ncbi:tyrosine-type recombinase/integrase [Marinobacter adhaerens]|uniref:Tyrosine-type recombinase/integrase n=1 Tax=Marinobacter adhaerens TaxID=1033846 RepID=A0A851I179_9GAMM|nr:site-specific integrase [Marinobacter adhaerens]NWN92855.1 tyrosine-type recombinase/integrase [Marinobacter adhaerens]